MHSHTNMHLNHPHTMDKSKTYPLAYWRGKQNPQHLNFDHKFNFWIAYLYSADCNQGGGGVHTSRLTEPTLAPLHKTCIKYRFTFSITVQRYWLIGSIPQRNQAFTIHMTLKMMPVLICEGEYLIFLAFFLLWSDGYSKSGWAERSFSRWMYPLKFSVLSPDFTLLA